MRRKQGRLRLIEAGGDSAIGTLQCAVIARSEATKRSRTGHRPLRLPKGDELVLEAAVNGGAQAIATFNRRDYFSVAGAFAIEILLPGEILRRLR
jgi:hypothetical protein